MYCVIQKIENKKPNTWGGAKKLEVDTFSWSIGNDKPKTKYTYKFTGKFERSIKTAYRISIHKSYRENGQLKKKQWVLCTMSYYALIDACLYDYADSKIVKLSDKTGVSADDIYNMVNEKLNPIIEAVTKEYEATEEYKTKKKHDVILKKYREVKEAFEKKYGNDTYDYCYDVFGRLRNKEYLEELQKNYEAQQKYYQDFSGYYGSNQNNYDCSSYFENKQSNYTDNEKEYLKVIYRAAAMKLHPDIKKDNGEGMKFLNKLKDQWGI